MTAGTTTARYAPLGDDRFLNLDTGEHLAFARDARSRPVTLLVDSGTNAFDRIGYFDSEGFANLLMILLGFALGARGMALWLYRKEQLTESTAERLARYATIVVIPVWLIFGFAGYKDINAANSLTAPHMAHYPTAWAWVWIVSGVAAAFLTVVLLAGLIPVWQRGSWSRPRRVAYTAYALLGVTFVGLMHYWNVLGLRMLG